MAEYISMKQVPGGIVTATDDRILYDYLVNSGIVYGCEISYLGNNMIHINAGYGIIKGGLFEIEDHTEYVDYAESGAVNGQIYIHFDAAADDKIKIVKETSANPHQMIQNEDANFDNGIYEIQLCTFRATTTALTLVRQTFVKSVMPIDVLDTLEAIEANTEANKAAGALAVKALNSRFHYDSNGFVDGRYTGADTWSPFSSSAILMYHDRINDVWGDRVTNYNIYNHHKLYIVASVGCGWTDNNTGNVTVTGTNVSSVKDLGTPSFSIKGYSTFVKMLEVELKGDGNIQITQKASANDVCSFCSMVIGV